MKTMFTVTAAGLLALTSLAAGPIFAQGGPEQRGPSMRQMSPGGPGGPGFGRGPGGPMGLLGDLGRGLRQLNLTDAQREQVRGIAEARQTEFKEIGDRMRVAQQALQAQVTADPVDEAAIRAKSGELAAVQADAAVLRARVHQEVFSILTAEQQARARELRAEAQSRVKERGEQRPPRQRQPGAF